MSGSVCIIDGRDLRSMPLVCLRWHNIHIKFHGDRFRHSSNIKVIASTIAEAVVLVLLMGGNYEVRRWDDFRCHDTYIEIHDDRFWHSSNVLWLLPQQLQRLQCWYYWCEGFMKYAVELTSGGMIIIPSLMKTGTDLKVVREGCTTDRHTRRWSHMPILFKIRKVGWKYKIKWLDGLVIRCCVYKWEMKNYKKIEGLFKPHHIRRLRVFY
jgi:hypothetical protein